MQSWQHNRAFCVLISAMCGAALLHATTGAALAQGRGPRRVIRARDAQVREWIHLGRGPRVARPRVVKPAIKKAKTGYRITIDVPGLGKRPTTGNGELFVSLDIPGWARNGDVGRPAVPTKTLLLPLPDGVGPAVKVTGISEIQLKNVHVVPAQDPPPDGNFPLPAFRKSRQTYGSDDLYPRGNVIHTSVGRIRNRRVLSVVVSPVRVQPRSRQALVAESLEIEVSWGKGAAGDQGATPPSEYLPTGSTNGVPSKYMVLMDDQYSSNTTLSDFIFWKRRKGYDVVVVKTSDINAGGSPTHSEIVNYMRGLSATNYPEYLLIVGDHTAANGVEGLYFSTMSGGWSDLQIACRDNTDYFPDLYHGRLPATDNSSLTSMLTKVLQMDRAPPAGKMYQRVLVAGQIQDSDRGGVADRLFCETADSLGCYFEQDAGGVDYDCWRAVVNPHGVMSSCQWNPNSILWNSGDQIGTRVHGLFVSESVARSRISQRINEGVCLVQHRDHGSVDGWGDPHYVTSDVNALTNGQYRPLVLSINCLTGAYHSNNNFARAWMEHSAGGAYAVIAAVDVSYSWCNDWLTHGFCAGFLTNYISWHNACSTPDWPGDLPDPGGSYGGPGCGTRLGQMLNFGKMYMYEHNDFNPGVNQDTFRLFHTFGDPESFVQLRQPRSLTVTHDSIVGRGSVTVEVDAGESDCQVCLYSGPFGIHAVTNSGQTGETFFGIDTDDTGTVHVTVTKFGCRPYEGTIDVAGSVVGFSAAKYEVLEDAGSLLVTVIRQGDLTITSAVDYATSNGTALAGSDYTAVSGTLHYAAGDTTNSFTVSISDDGSDETGESFYLLLGNCSSNTYRGDQSSAEVLIEDDDGAGELSLGAAAIGVGEAAIKAMVQVRRRNGFTGQVTVDFATSNMTASAGMDYVATNGTLTFADSVRTAGFDVIVFEDIVDEPNETVFLSLGNASGGAVLTSPSNAVLTIEDNDVAGSLSFDSVLYTVSETGTGCTVRVARTGGSDGVVSVDFATSNGTASAGEDYTATNGTLTMAHGVTSAVFRVSVLDDSLTEGMESFTVRLTGPTGGATIGAAGEALVTIDDDEAIDIALFADPMYVDTGLPPSGEVTNLHAALQAKGYVVRRFSGITASDFSSALAAADILHIPELEKGNLGAALTTAAKDVISSFVSGGSGLVLNGDRGGNASAFVNAVFGYAAAPGNVSTPSSITSHAEGTPFGAGPSSIAENNATTEWISSSLPAGALSIYEVTGADRTAVALVEYGGGLIAFLAYDWYDAVPLGTQDGGWDEVLGRAVRTVLEGSDDMVVLPGGALYSSGAEGGPFSPTGAVYTVSNRGTSTVPWSAGCEAPWVTVTPSAGVLAAGATGTVAVAINSSAEQLACGAYRTDVAFTNTISGAVRRRTVELDVWGAASLPFVEDFETGAFRPWWRITGTAGYRTQVASAYGPHGGSYHATMDSFGGSARNELTLVIDLAGYKDVELTFWGVEWGDEPHGPPPIPFTGGYDFDGVAVSEDGVSWYEVQDLRTLSSTYAQRTVDLDAAIAAHGLSYNSTFRIRFNQYDNSAITVDGIGIDDVSVTGVLADPLLITPRHGLSSSGYEGGPFTPVSAEYALENMETSDVPWSVAWTSIWVSVVPAAGTLTPGASTNVSVLINPNANGLVPGLYSDTVVFSNHVSGFLQSRDVALDIAPIPGEIEVLDSIAPINDRSMPFGAVIVGISRGEQITVRNTNALHGLIVDDILLQQGTNGSPCFALANLPALPHTVPPGGSETFDVTFTPEAYVSTQAVVLIRSNDEDEPNVRVALSGRGVEDYLKVTPDAIQEASGHPGGPFVPSNLVYAASNIGPAAFYWSVTHTQSWLQVSPVSGALLPGATNSVAVRLTSLADTLPEGVHEDTLVYHNETTGMDHPRRVTLTVYTSPEIWVSPTSFNVTNKLNGSVSRVLTIGNDGDGELNVTITSAQTGYPLPDSRADVVLDRVDDNTMVLEYEFAEPSIEEHGDYHSVSIEGLRDYLRVGAPIVPVRPATLVVPWGKQVVGVRVRPVESVRLQGVYRLPPAQRAFPLSRPELKRVELPDPAVYKKAEAWPGKYHEEQDVQSQRGYRLLTLGLLPVQYTPPSGRIDYARRLRVEVELVDMDDTGVLRVWEQTERSIGHRSDNPGTLATYPRADHPARPPADLTGGPYEYVIITTPTLAGASGAWNFQALRDARIAEGMTAIIVTTDWVYGNYSGTRPDGGTDNQTRIRNFVADAYAKWGTRYVLLGGVISLVPARMFWVEAYAGMSTTMPVDMYYGCVEPFACTFDGDADGIYGEPTDGVSGADVDLEAEVFVGRAAVEDATELAGFVRKVLAYEETTPEHLPRVAMLGEYLGGHFVPPYAKDLMEEIRLGGTSHGYSTTGFENHARPDFYDFNTLTNLYDRDVVWAASDAVDLMNAPMHVINHLGHANRQYTMKMYNTDLLSVTNTDYCFIYSQGCMPGYFDLADCFAEEVTAMEHGAFAVVMNARYGWGTGDSSEGPSQSYNRQFWDAVLAEDMLELGRANQDSKEDNRWDINRDCMRWCYYELNLFGDPAQRFRFQQKCSWLAMDVTTSTIPGGASTNIEIRFDAAGLGAGVYIGDIILSSNDRSTPVTNVPMRMTVIPDDLRIRPKTGFASRGPEGGPFDPVSAVYSLTNTGPSSLVWTVDCPVPWIDVSATGGVLNAGADTNVTVSLNAAANALPGDLYGASVTFSNTVSGAAQPRLVSLDIKATAGIPFLEDFESGSALSNYWEVTGTGAHRTEVSTLYSPYAGSGHLTMDSLGGGARNELTLTIDLAEYENVVLTFWAKEFSDEAHGPPPVPFVGGADFDGVAISADGTNWYEVQELRTTIGSLYQQFTVDLDAAIAAHGLSYGGQFKIRFNHYDDGSLTIDGFAFDDIRVDAVREDDLSVAPRAGLDAHGYTGGPFSPSNKVYSLTNRGTSNLVWSATRSAAWVSVAPQGGVLIPGATTDVAVAVNTNAGLLTIGTHAATVLFTNVTSGHARVRPVIVTVRERPGPPTVPCDPIPTNGAVGLSPETCLWWNGSTNDGMQQHDRSPYAGPADASTNMVRINFDDLGFVPDSGITFYDVYLGTNASNMARVAQGLAECTCSPGFLDFSTTYFWQVVASNAVGCTTGAVWQFTTAEDAIRFGSAEYEEHEYGLEARITVVRGNGGLAGVGVDYATSDGTAIAGVDYVAATGRLFFAAGQLTNSFTVRILDDGVQDGAETVNLTLSNPSAGAVLVAPERAILVIDDDDGFFDDFDPDIDLPQWSEFGGTVGTTVVATNHGGFVSGPNSLWFGDYGMRYAATRSLNTSGGGNISFFLRYGLGASPWETLDLPGEAVALEYSTNAGLTWVETDRYIAEVYRNWTQVTSSIPVGARSTDTRFRWRQLSHSGSNCDHWALDDVAIGVGHPGDLRVNPLTGMSSLGYESGPFVPSNATYFLSNVGTSSVNWSACSSAAWVEVSSTGGVLVSGAGTNVVVSLSSGAASLPAGTNTAAVVFSNTVSGIETRRDVTVVVRRRVLDHFTWEGVGATQYVDCAFPVTVTARDATGQAFPGFTGAVEIAGWVSDATVSTNILGWPATPMSSIGTYTLGYSFTPTNDLTVTHVRHYFGTKVSVWTDVGTLLASRSITNVPGAWAETPLATSIVLSAGTRYRVAAYTGYERVHYYRLDMAPVFPHGSIDVSCRVWGDAFPNEADLPRWRFVGLCYTVGAESRVSVTPTNSADFIGGVWTGAVTVLQTATNMSLRADDGSGHRGDSAAFDVSPRVPLVLSLPNVVTEGAGTFTGRVGIARAPDSDLAVSLASDDTTELTVTGATIIPAGQTNGYFVVTVVDDDVLDGSRAGRITASAASCGDGSAAVTVHDNEAATLGFVLPSGAREGSTVTGQVTVSALVDEDVVVALAGDDPSEVTVPASVVVPSGQSSAPFVLTAVDDAEIDGTQSVGIEAFVQNWTAGAGSIDVLDDEHTNLIVTLPASVREGDGMLANAGRVAISGTLTSNLTVLLTSDDTTELDVAPATIITAGSTSVTFDAYVQNDSERDGVQTARVTAAAAGFVDGSIDVTVFDDEGEIRGGKWEDLNTNGIWDAGEPGLQGWKIYVDANTNGQWDAGEAFDVTDTNGNYALGVMRGTHLLAEEQQAYWTQTFPGTNGVVGTGRLALEQVVKDGVGGVDGLDWVRRVRLSPDGRHLYAVAYDDSAVSVFERDVDSGELSFVQVLKDGVGGIDGLAGAWGGCVDPSGTHVYVTGMHDDAVVVFRRDTGSGLPGTHLVKVAPDQAVTNINFGNVPPEPRFMLDVPDVMTEGDGTVTGCVNLALAPESNVVVSLMSDDVSEIAVTNTVTIPAGQTNADFEVTVVDDDDLDGPQTVTITASAPEYIAGETTIVVNDDETTTLSVALPASVTEGDGILVGQGTVVIGAVPSNDFVVLLSSDDNSEIVVTNAVTIPTGRTNAAFDLVVVDDGEIDGAQSVVISADLDGWTGGSNSVIVADNEHNRLLLGGVTLVREGVGAVTGGVTVGISGVLPGDLLVTFGSSDTTEAAVSGPALIPAGRTSATADLLVVDDDETDGTQRCEITAVAGGFVTGTNEVLVADNDVHRFVFAAIDDPQTSRVPFSVTLTASDTNGAPIPTYTGAVSMAGAGAGGPVTVAPTNMGPFVAGQWSGSVAVQPVDSNVVLTVDDGLGHMGSSSPFDVSPYPPPPAHSPDPLHLATGVPASTDLAWGCGDTNASAVDVTYAVRFGTNPVPGTNELQGTTASRSWDLPPLKPYTTYYWQIVSKRDGIETLGPVWQFTTEGVNYLSWDPVASPQLVGAGFPVCVTARDANGAVVTGFTGTVDLSGWAQAEIYRADFEAGLDGFTIDNSCGSGSGLWHRSSGRGGDSGHSASNSFYYGRGEGPTGGGDYDAGNTAGALISPSIDLSAAQAPVVLSFTYLLATENYAGYDVAEVMVSTNGGPFETIAGNQGTGVSLTDPTAGTWASASVDISACAGAEIRVRFVFDTVEGTRNNYEGWYVDDVVVRARGVRRVPVQPTTSGGFVSGVWTGNMTVGAVAADMYLHADDGTHAADSSVFDVGALGALAVEFAGPVTEGDGTLTGFGRITISVPQTNDVIMSLVSGDPDEVTVPAGVSLPALSNSVVFDVTIGDDVECDGMQHVAVVAGAVGFESSSGMVSVADNDVHHFSFDSVADPQTSAIPFNVTLSACDVNGVLIPSYSGSARLSAAGAGGTAGVMPTNTGVITSGQWTGALVIDSPDSNVVVSADDGAGLAGASNPFDVLPNPLCDPVPADLAMEVGTDTDLSWSYSAQASNTVFRVYFGTTPIPGTNELMGATGNTAWALPPLLRETTYYWRVEADDRGVTVGGPVWQFSTETITCFRWSTIGSPQLMNHPFAVTVTALDACDRTVTGFTGTVNLNGWGVGELLRADFEAGPEGFSVDNGFGAGSGLWHRTTGRGTGSGHTASNSFYYGQGEGPAGGGNYDAGNSEGVLVSPVIDLSNATVFASLSFRYLLETEGEAGYDAVSVEVSSDGAPFEVVAGNQGVGTSLLDPTAGAWVSASVDLSAYLGTRVRIRFRFATADETRNAYEGWYVDDVVLRGGGVAPVSIRPDCSAGFMSGVWTGNVTVTEGATEMWLCADDGNGHIGASTSFDVGTVTPRGTPVPWLVARGLTNSSPLAEELLDLDRDGMYAWQEYIADTDPMVAESVLEISGITASGGTIRVEWHGGEQARQYLERRHDLLSTSEQWTAIHTNEPITSTTNAYDDISTEGGAVFYRIKVERPQGRSTR